MTAKPELSALAGARLERNGVDLRMSRASIRARLFGGDPDPTRLGRFVVVERVGSGGMGIVYAAYDPQLDRKVALKVLRNDVVSSRREQHQRRLLQEARSMAKLSAANVVTVFEVGAVDDQVFVAMEFIEAPTLRRWISETDPSPEEILRVLRAAGQGLVAAHDAGIVHRDFKPENVLVPSEGPVQVTDFGLAIPVAEERRTPVRSDSSVAGASATVLTQALAGTPAYMAPEQLADGDASVASDQFSFCVTLFEALVGERPYSEAALRTCATGSELPAVSVPDSAGVGAKVVRAIERGLSFEPAHRFGSMRELLAELAPRRRSRTTVVAVASIAAAAAGVAVASYGEDRPCPRRGERMAGVWDPAVRGQGESAFAGTRLAFANEAWLRASSELDDYAGRWLDAHREACLASHRGEQSDERLDRRMLCLDARLAELEAASRVLTEADAEVVENSMRVVGGLRSIGDCDDPSGRALAGASALEAAPAELAASIRRAAALRRAGRFEEAATRAAEAVTRAESSGADGVLAYALLSQARGERALARLDEAEAALGRAVSLAGESEQFDLVASAAIERAELTGVGRADFEAGLMLAEAAEIAVASAGKPAPLDAKLQLLLARLHYATGRFDTGLQHAERGLSVLEDHAGAANADLADALQLQGTLLYAKGRLADARQFGERALELRTEVFGPSHPAVADSLSNLAAVALAGGDPSRAIELFGRAVELHERALGAEHPGSAKLLSNLASSKLASGDLEGAKDGYVESLRRFDRTATPDDPRIAAISSNLGSVQFELGELEAAIETFEHVRQIQRSTLGDDHPQLAVTLSNLGRARLESGDASGAREVIERALEIRTAKLGADHVTVIRSRMDLAAVYMVLERYDEATATLGKLPDNPEVDAEWNMWSGVVALARGKHDDAARRLERALALRTEREAPAPAVAATKLVLAHARAQQGDADTARRLANEAAPVIGTGRPPSELREFCGPSCEDELAALR